MQQAGTISPPALPPSGFQQRVSDAITGFCGDLRFVYLHTLLFGAWIASRGFGHDKFPFNFLTMAVSLEAIFLSTFILISQNRQQAIAEANNKTVQDALLQMLRDVVSDEKIDQKNEELIQKLLDRIDVEHIQPIAAKVDEITEALPRIEATLSRLGPSQAGGRSPSSS
jgi:uncharacterized membrane protein